MTHNLSRICAFTLAVLVGLTGATLGLAEQASATTVCIEDLPLGCFDPNQSIGELVTHLKESAGQATCEALALVGLC